MQATARKIAIAAFAALGLAALSASPASARWHGGGHFGGFHHGFHHFGGFHHGFHHRHFFGPRFGFAIGAPYYAYPAYAYDPDCFVRRRVFINRFGARVIRWVRVCY